MQIEIGQTFAHYEILGKLGHGGMAIVYKAHDIQRDQLVALKVMYQHFMTDENALKRFEREATVISTLNHTNIVPLIDYGQYENQAYFAMQYMQGNSLADSFKRPRGIIIKHTLRLLEQIASALDYAHAKGIVHRDLKLQNILLDADKNAYLADFGIARIVDATRLTRTGNVAGTPLYMSPEQARGQFVDYRSDIYSLGVMAYLMITGYFPFTADDMLAILHKHVSEYPSEPSEINADLPEAVNSVLLRVLMKDPDDRFDTATAFVKALEDALVTTESDTTRIIVDIHAMNPKQSSTRYQDAPRSEVIASVTKDTTNNLQSPPTQQNNNRFRIMGGVMLLFLMIGIGALVMVLQNNRSEATSLLMATQLRNEFETELTATKDALIFAETQIADLTAQPQERETLPPTWTLTPTQFMTPSPDRIRRDEPSAKAISGIPIYAEPDMNSDIIFDLFEGDTVQVLGRSESGLWVEIGIPGIVDGWVHEQDMIVNVDMTDVPITWVDDEFDQQYFDDDYFIATVKTSATLYFEPSYACGFIDNTLQQYDEIDLFEVTTDGKWVYGYVFETDQDGWIEASQLDIPFDLQLLPQTVYDWGCD